MQMSAFVSEVHEIVCHKRKYGRAVHTLNIYMIQIKGNSVS